MGLEIPGGITTFETRVEGRLRKPNEKSFSSLSQSPVLDAEL